MRITSILCATAVTILIKVDTLICTITDVYDLPKLTSDTPSSTNPEITTNDSDVQPLPWETFTKEVSELLSPDIFSQTNPLAYLLAKVKNLPRGARQTINHNIITPLWRATFPKRYIPYAELASSLLACLSQLDSVKEMIEIIQSASKSNNPFKPLNMSIIEHGSSSSLFSPDVFSDSNPPVRLLSKLLAIPEKDISNTNIRLQNLLKNRLFPRRYFGYLNSLLKFFNHEYLLQNLKTNVAKIQPNQHDVSSAWKLDEFDVESHDQPIPESNLSSKQDSSLLSKVVDSSHNDHQVVHHQQQKYFSNYVVNFLSPDTLREICIVNCI